VVWSFHKDETGKIVETSDSNFYVGIAKIVGGIVGVIISVGFILSAAGVKWFKQ
jgi:hypothetical protein